mgnify:FL=1
MMRHLIWKPLFPSCQHFTQSNNTACFKVFISTLDDWNDIYAQGILLLFLIRLPVIQSLVVEVKQITQSMLLQLLQRLRSSIQVRVSFLSNLELNLT